MMTSRAPVSRTIAALISPVNAPSRSQCRFCAADADDAAFARRLRRPRSDVNGGAITTSTPTHVLDQRAQTR